MSVEDISLFHFWFSDCTIISANDVRMYVSCQKIETHSRARVSPSLPPPPALIELEDD